MPYYVDTSVLVAALTAEAATAKVTAWLEARGAADSLYTSDWVETEIASALSLKVRTGQLTASAREAAFAEWQLLRTAGLLSCEITAADVTAATSMLHRPEQNLRASDALHLAIARRHGLTVATLDQAMATAGLANGVKTLML